MNKIIDQKKLNEIIDNLKKREFDFALEKIKKLSHNSPKNYTINKLFASTYFKKMDLEEQKTILRNLVEVNKATDVDMPYRLKLIKSNIEPSIKSVAMKNLSS